MAGRVDRLERPVLSVDPVAFVEREMGVEVHVAALAAADLGPLIDQPLHRVAHPRAVRAVGMDLRAGLVGDHAGAGAVVVVGMGDEDMADPLARGQGVENRAHMGGAVRAGVDQCHVARADQIGLGAGERVGRGVLAGDAAHAGGDRLGLTVDGGRVLVERVGHCALLVTGRSGP